MTGNITRDEAATSLVAEDDDDVRALIGEVLGSLGLATRTVSRGDDALLAIRSQAPQLLVLDVAMPGLSGLEVCRRVRASELGPEIAILLVSGESRPEDVEAGYAAGADDYLTKPFTAAQLAARVQQLLTPAATVG